MDTIHVDTDVIHCLRKAGWSETRQIDTTEFENWYDVEGYERNPQALSILRSVGRLTVEPLHDGQQIYGCGPVEFDPIMAGAGERHNVATTERRLGTTLTPLGELEQVRLLLLSKDGRVYAERSDLGVWLLGEDFRSALETVVLARRRTSKVLEALH